jgi:ATP-binding cassette, subfamily B, bacterial
MNIPLRQYWHLLINYLKPQRKRAVVLAALLFGGITMQLLTPQIMRRFIDNVMEGSPLSTLVNLALLFLGVALVQQVFSLGAIYTGENVGWTATNALRADLAEHCLKLDLSFHNAHSPGEMIERLDGDINNLSNFFSQFVVGVVGNAFLLVGILVLLWREDWRIGLALTLFAVWRCSSWPAFAIWLCRILQPSARLPPSCSVFWKSACRAPKISAPTAGGYTCCGCSTSACAPSFTAH